VSSSTGSPSRFRALYRAGSFLLALLSSGPARSSARRSRLECALLLVSYFAGPILLFPELAFSRPFFFFVPRRGRLPTVGSVPLLSPRFVGSVLFLSVLPPGFYPPCVPPLLRRLGGLQLLLPALSFLLIPRFYAHRVSFLSGRGFSCFYSNDSRYQCPSPLLFSVFVPTES